MDDKGRVSGHLMLITPERVFYAGLLGRPRERCQGAFNVYVALKGGLWLMHPHVVVILHALEYLRSHLTEMTDRPSNEINKEPACDAADASPEKARPVQNVVHGV